MPGTRCGLGAMASRDTDISRQAPLKRSSASSASTTGRPLKPRRSGSSGAGPGRGRTGAVLEVTLGQCSSAMRALSAELKQMQIDRLGQRAARESHSESDGTSSVHSEISSDIDEKGDGSQAKDRHRVKRIMSL
mmetsp:Transcript_920/g.2100  ORF Transcript_920/g.2100 Transcript_920/m.2100 type:complete len:134 (+) Transcript_920:61-462(+)